MFRTVWLLRNLSLDGELFLRDGKNAAFVKSLPSLLMLLNCSEKLRKLEIIFVYKMTLIN